MNRSSIRLIYLESCNSALALGVCKGTDCNGMQCWAVEDLGMEKTEGSQGCWITNCCWKWATGCCLPINVRTRKCWATRTSGYHLPSVVIKFYLSWTHINRCARLYTSAVLIYELLISWSTNIIPTTSSIECSRALIIDVIIRPSPTTSKSRLVTYSSSDCCTIRGRSDRKCKCQRIGFRFYCRVLD